MPLFIIFIQNVIPHPLKERNYWEYQSEVPQNVTTTEQIFCIGQILEREWEYIETVHQLFVDFGGTR
jgi:hypothetical protein